MVAAWIRADTGVGPAMASGNHVYNGICALLPVAPTNSKRVITVISVLLNLSRAAVVKISLYETVSSLAISQNTAIRKARSPIRFIIKALLAALLYSGFLNQ